MSQSGYTPIQLYYSTTAAAVPVNTNLANGELAINITDGKLYYKDNTGTVKVIAGAGGAGVAGGSTTQVQYNSSGSLAGSANMTFDGTTLTAAGFSGPHNGTVGATTANTGAFTTLAASSTVTLSGGTANGVTYLNGSKVLTSGSALTYSATSGLTTNGVTQGYNTTLYTVDGTLSNYSAANNVYLNGNTAGGLNLRGDGTGGASTQLFLGGATSSEANKIIFTVASSEGMRLTSTGLGIGTSSPTQALSLARTVGNSAFISIAGNGNTPATAEVLVGQDTSSNAYLFNRANAPILFGTNNATTMTLSATGNLGLGVTPSAWRSSRTALQLGNTVSAITGNSQLEIRSNAYLDTSATEIYINSYYANKYIMSAGQHIWYTAPSGTAGTAITFTQQFAINNSGAIGLGSGNSTGTSGQVLTSGGSGAAPTWTTVSGGGGSPATPTVSGTVYGSTNAGSRTFIGYSAGAVNTGNNNTGVGGNSLNAMTSGYSNTAVGSNSLLTSATGYANTGIGTNALYSTTTGFQNASVGTQSLQSNTTGSNNVAFGNLAGFSNTTGSNNVAVGPAAIYSNTTGTNNTSVGYYALYANTTASGSTAVGYQALYSNTGDGNTATGQYALTACTTGLGNVGIGSQVAQSLTTGQNNVCMGRGAGLILTTGNENTLIGRSAGEFTGPTTGSRNVLIGLDARASAGGGNDQLVIVSGATATGKGDSTGFINPNTGGVYQGNNSSTWSTTSDRRLKKNIVNNDIGLEKLTQIQVRNFEYRLPEEVDAELQPTDAIKKTGIQLGVIAQELQIVLPDCVKTESTGVMSVDTDNLTWYLINAIKELSVRIKQLEGN